MLQAISWTHYFEGAAILLVCYYAGVALIYYRQEIRVLLQGGKPSPGKTASQTPASADDTASFEKLESLVHEIDSILDSAGKGATKEQLLAQVNRKLASYDGLRLPAYRVAVFNHIIGQAEEICGVGFSADELEAGWESHTP